MFPLLLPLFLFTQWVTHVFECFLCGVPVGFRWGASVFPMITNHKCFFSGQLFSEGSRVWVAGGCGVEVSFFRISYLPHHKPLFSDISFRNIGPIDHDRAEERSIARRPGHVQLVRPLSLALSLARPSLFSGCLCFVRDGICVDRVAVASSHKLPRSSLFSGFLRFRVFF